MSYSRFQDIAQTSYPAVQLALSPELHGLRDREIEALVFEQFPDASPEDVENFMSTLQGIGKKVGPLAQKALPGVIQGASTGMVAGPWGAVIGGVAGGAASLLAPSKSAGAARPQGQAQRAPAQQRPRRRAPQPSPPSAPRRAPQPPPSSPRPAQPSRSALPVAAAPRSFSGSRAHGSSDAAVEVTAKLLLLLARPEVQQALMALLMGTAGRSSVTVGGAQVPVETVVSTLAELSGQVAHQSCGSAEHAPAASPLSEALFSDLMAAPLVQTRGHAVRADEDWAPGAGRFEDDTEVNEEIDILEHYDAQMGDL